LIAAASRGLGKAVALQLAKEGADIAICARGEEELGQTAAEIEERTGANVLAIPTDVTWAREVNTLVEATGEQFGTIDILVTNAGGPPPGEFMEFTEGDWETATRLTLLSAVHLCRAVIPIMQQQKEGSILAMTSVSVKQPLPRLVLSNSLRLGVIGMIKTLAEELGPFGIRANAICPGWTRTSRVEQLLKDRADKNGTTPEEEASAITDDVPLGRMATPDEFAKAATFLVSPAASYITGEILLVDGGLARATL
jgi:3-oxoacyl-[acyl-carrier protein] reductase